MKKSKILSKKIAGMKKFLAKVAKNLPDFDRSKIEPGQNIQSFFCANYAKCEFYII